jgi:uncharacterized protein (DUF169 family)
VDESCVKGWEDAARSLEKFLRLRTFPIGLKLCKDTEPFSSIRNLRKPTRKVLLCQLVTVARTNGWTLGIRKEMLLDGSPCAAMIGFGERKKVIEEGDYRGAIWFKTVSDGKKYEAVFPHLPLGENNALLIGPVSSDKFQPDIVLLYGTPAQMIFVVNALQWENYERLTFYCSGESSCADYIAGCYLSQRPQLTIPCFGERVYGHAQEEELVMALPADRIGKVLEGLSGLSKRGVRYPIPFAGPQLDVATKLPSLYLDIYGIADRPLFELWNA